MAETTAAAADGSNARTQDDGAREQPQPQQDEETSLRRRPSTSSTSSRPREATELDEIATATPTHSHSTASLSSGEYRVTPRLSLASSSHVLRHGRQQDGLLQPLRRFWSRNVALVVEHKGNRDYFGTSPLPS